MSVTSETYQPAMGPYLSMAAGLLALNARSAVFRASLFVNGKMGSRPPPQAQHIVLEVKSSSS